MHYSFGFKDKKRQTSQKYPRNFVFTPDLRSPKPKQHLLKVLYGVGTPTSHTPFAETLMTSMIQQKALLLIIPKFHT